MILKSDKNACLQLVSDQQDHIQTQGFIHCIQHNKYLSWLYCNDELRLVILIDPPPVEQEAVSLIESSNAQYFFIVLTGCHRRKKDSLVTWISIFPFTILTPQTITKEMLISCERIIDNDTVHVISCEKDGKKIFIGHVIGSILGWYRSILLHIPPYLFSGHIMQHHNTHQYSTSVPIQNFLHSLSRETIVLPELGGIHLLHT